MAYPQTPTELFLGDHLFVFSFTLESFSERNIHCKHSKKVLSKRKWDPNMCRGRNTAPAVSEVSRSWLGPLGPSPAEGMPRSREEWVIREEHCRLWSGFRVWQVQTARPPASLTCCAAGRLRVTPGSLSSCSRPWARAPLLSVVFYDSRSWSPDARKPRRPACALLIWLWPSGRGVARGKAVLSHHGALH